LSDKEKEARAKQFARQAKKDEDDPSAYKAPPSNKGAKTKPSKHTIKYKKMFGETIEVELDEQDLSDKAMMMRLTRQAMKAPGGSRKQKELIKKLNTYREKMGMKPLNAQFGIYDIPPFRVSGIVGEFDPSDLDEAFESAMAIDEAFDELIETIEQLDEKKGKRMLKAYSVFNYDPSMSPLSHAIPTDNYQIEDDNLLTPKMNQLLRMGLAKKSDLEKYRRALKSGEKGLTNPILRRAMLDVLDKLIDIVSDDSTAFQRVRNAVLKGRTDTGPMDEQDAVKQAKARIKREKEADKAKFDAILDRARLQDARAKNREESFDALNEKALKGLKKKSEKSGIPYSILKKVYDRGMAAWRTGHRPGATQQQWAYARVNSFLTGGKTRTTADADLWKKAKAAKKSKKEEVTVEDQGPCWDGYVQRGMKKKGDRMVPNCVPEETNLEEMPRWLLEPLSKVTRRRGYDAAKKVLQDVLTRKKKEAGRKGLQHSIEYYAGQIARQFDGVDARVLAKMVAEEMGPVEIGTNEIRRRYQSMTPGQPVESYPRGSFRVEDLDESFVMDKSAGVGQTLFASDLGIKFEAGFAHHPDTLEEMEDEACCDDCNEELEITEAEYQGRKVKLNDPFRTPKGPKKFSVYVKNDKGNVVKVNFGSPDMEIKRDDPERRKSFRARHNCDEKKDKTTAGYWSCRMWEKGTKVSDLD